MSRKRKFLIVVLAAAVLIVGLLAYIGLSHPGGKALSIAELKDQGDSAFGRTVQVKGEVKHGSIEWDYQSQVMRFALTDALNTLDVIYRGVAPDSFKAGKVVAVEGRYTEGGVFEAQSFASTGSFLCTACH